MHDEPVPPWASQRYYEHEPDYSHIYPPGHFQQQSGYPRDPRYPSNSLYRPGMDPRYQSMRLPDGRPNPRYMRRDNIWDRPTAAHHGGGDGVRRTASTVQHRPSFYNEHNQAGPSDEDPFGLGQAAQFGSLPQQHARSRSDGAAFHNRPRTYSNFSNSSMPFDIGNAPSNPGHPMQQPSQRPQQHHQGSLDPRSFPSSYSQTARTPSPMAAMHAQQVPPQAHFPNQSTWSSYR